MEKIELTPEQQKNRLVEMLVWFDGFAKKHDLKYFLAFGTLLGAVRHKGFIPWDDDIDLIMLREDYDRMIHFFGNEYNSNYELKCYQLDRNYYYPYAKLIDLHTEMIEDGINSGNNMGLFLDIFPLDSGPENANEYGKRVILFNKLNSIIDFMLNSRQHKSKGLKKLVVEKADVILKSPCVSRSFMKLYEKQERKYNKTDSDYLVNYPHIYLQRKFKKDWFLYSIQIPFEGKNYPAPYNFNAFLIECYGDYMELPPEERRIPRHKLTAYMK